MFGMARQWFTTRRQRDHWKRRTALYSTAFLLCATILAVTVFEKFLDGGWLTLVATGSLVGLCFYIRGHYRALSYRLARLYAALKEIPRDPTAKMTKLDPKLPTAGVMVSGYSGAGIHTTLTVFRLFPGQFKGIVFLSVGVIDSGVFKGEEEIEALRQQTERSLQRYVALAESQGIPATCRMVLGTDVVEEAAKLCVKTVEEFPRLTFFAGKVLFEWEGWIHRLLHNETAVAVQARLHWKGHTMIILPIRVDPAGAPA